MNGEAMADGPVRRTSAWEKIILLVIFILLAAPALHAAAKVETIHRGGVTADLIVELLPSATAPGAARMVYDVNVTGGAGLEVETPRLVDASNAWKEERHPAKREAGKDRVAWTERIELQQTKPGLIPPPGVKVRFRDRPEDAWQEAAWLDILRKPRDDAVTVEKETPAANFWGRLALALAVAALLATAALLGWKRRRRSAGKPLPADQWALQELTRLEKTTLPPAAEADGYHTLLSNVLRRYLAERFGWRAPQQTTAEFLFAMRQTPQLDEEQQKLLREFLARCDLAKFAHVPMSAEECRQTTALAQTIVRKTARTTLS